MMHLRHGTRMARKSQYMNPDGSARHARVSERELSRDEGADTRNAQLGRQIRELVQNLMRDVLGVVATASATELGELLAQAGDISLKRAAAKAARAYGRSTLRRVEPALPAPRREFEKEEGTERRAALPADPFDITSPGELLASPDEISPSARETSLPEVHEQPPTPQAPAPTEARPAADSATALRDVESDAASERRPKVVLRAGESILSATGSGVVIRRERRVAPKE